MHAHNVEFAQRNFAFIMLPEVLYSSGNVFIKNEERNNKNRGKFRHLARQVSREVFDVPENNQVLFMYVNQYGNEFLCGQISFSLPDMNMREPGVGFDSDYYPQISFLFVQRDFQGQGFGKMLLTESLKIIKKDGINRPVRLQSAIDSVGFFEKCGFHTIGDPFDCIHAGSRLFETLVNMELS